MSSGKGTVRLASQRLPAAVIDAAVQATGTNWVSNLHFCYKPKGASWTNGEAPCALQLASDPAWKETTVLLVMFVDWGFTLTSSANVI
jgi:hypothetical protein